MYTNAVYALVLECLSACGTMSTPDGGTQAGTCDSVPGKQYMVIISNDGECSSNQLSSAAMEFRPDGGVLVETTTVCQYEQTGCTLTISCPNSIHCTAVFTDEDSFAGTCALDNQSCKTLNLSGFR